MKIVSWAGLAAAAALLAGCGDFWQAPGGGGNYSLSSSGSIAVAQGSSGTDTITVTPGSTFTGTVSLTCSVTSGPASATSSTDPTCSFSSSSLTFSSATAQTTTLTVSASSSTPLGAYQIKATGVSGSTAESTTFCAAVGSSTSSCTSTAGSGNFYILNATTLTGYTVSSSSMTAISGASATFTNATAMAIDSTGSYLFVASNAGITPFTISSAGALTKGAVFDANNSSIEALAVDPAGQWLLAASTAGILSAYPLSSGAYDSTSGRTVQSEILNLGTGSLYPTGIAISPSGYTNADIVAVAMGTTGTGLFTFTSSTTSGPLSTEWSQILTPIGSGSAVAVAIDPQNRLLYIGETNAFTTSGYTGALRVYNINSSGVKEFTYSSAYTPAGTGPHAILPSADGSYVYAASWDSDKITGYSVTTSALTSPSTIATGTQPNGLVEDSTGGFVLGISYGGSPTFDAYTLSSGALTSSTSNSTVSSPVAIVAVP